LGADRRLSVSSDFFQYYTVVEHLARKRFKRSSLAEEAQNYVLDALSADNWKKLRSYSMKGSFKAYLAQVVLRSLEDFARKRFGRIRPPAHIFVRGAFWIRLFQLMCVEGYSSSEASFIVLQEMPEQSDADSAYRAAKDIRGSVVDCGKRVAEVSLDEETQSENTDDAPLHCLPPEEFLEEARRLALLETLRTLLADADERAESLDFTKPEDCERILRSESIPGVNDRLLLRLIYQDGLTLGAAGKVLGLTISQTHSRLHRLLGRIRQTLAGSSEQKVKCHGKR
jgi:RNA polymerase sigma factor (sigma-70 family)